MDYSSNLYEAEQQQHEIGTEKKKTTTKCEFKILRLTLHQLRHVLQHVQDRLQPWPIYGQPKGASSFVPQDKKINIRNGHWRLNSKTKLQRKKAYQHVFIAANKISFIVMSHFFIHHQTCIPETWRVIHSINVERDYGISSE